MTLFTASSATILWIGFITVCASQHLDGDLTDKAYLDKIQAQLRRETMKAHHLLVNQTKILQQVTRSYIESRIKENLFKAVRARVEQELENEKNGTTTEQTPRQSRQEDEEEDNSQRAQAGLLPQLANVVTTFFGQDVNVTDYVKDATSFLPTDLSDRLVNAASLIDPNRFTSSTTPPPPPPLYPLVINGQIVPQGVFANGTAFTFAQGNPTGVFQQHDSFDFRKVAEQQVVSGGAVVPPVVPPITPGQLPQASEQQDQTPEVSAVVAALQPKPVTTPHPNDHLVQQSNLGGSKPANIPDGIAGSVLSAGAAHSAASVLPPQPPQRAVNEAPHLLSTGPVVNSQVGPRPVYVAQTPNFANVGVGAYVPVRPQQLPMLPLPELPIKLPELPKLPIHAGLIVNPFGLAQTATQLFSNATGIGAPDDSEEHGKPPSVDDSEEDYDLFARNDIQAPTTTPASTATDTVSTPEPIISSLNEYPAIRYAVRIFQRLTRTEKPPTTTEFMNTTTVATTPDYFDEEEPVRSAVTPAAQPGTLMRIVNSGLYLFEGAREAYQLLNQVNRFLDRVNDRFENAGYGADTYGIEVQES